VYHRAVSFLRNLRLSAKMALLVVIFLAVFVAFAVMMRRSLDHLKVNGPVYGDIVRGKDLIADVLPPPEYVIESYLLVLEMTNADQDQLPDLLERSARLRREFDKRHEVWVRVLPPGELRDVMLDEAYPPSREFMEVRDREFIPNITSPAKRQLALDAVPRLAQLYETHRKAVDRVVELATKENLLNEENARIDLDNANTAMWVLGGGVVAVVLAMGWIMTSIAAALTAKLRLATLVAEKVASGDLTARIDVTSDDEAGRLLSAIREMTSGLHQLVTRVKKASIDLMSTATELAATSKQQEGTVSTFGAATSQIAAAVREISATSQELLTTMDGVASVASETSKLAEGGRTGLSAIDSTMGQLTRASETITAKLAVIREKAIDINVVVTTITKVADQTNLLSVNAAIEAEKAGEYGLGFLVLAREIRRLADQTAVSTLDIELIVKEMQAAVSTGVMEMDKFSDEVRQGAASVAGIGAQLSEIIAQVHALSMRFESVNDGMRAQSQGARQINDAMVSLADGARQTTGSLSEFNNATDHLRDAVTELKQEISHFKVQA